jgi:hypothetical protein
MRTMLIGSRTWETFYRFLEVRKILEVRETLEVREVPPQVLKPQAPGLKPQASSRKPYNVPP